MQYKVRRYLLAVDDNLGNSTTLLALAAAGLHIAYYFLNSSIGYPDPVHARLPILAILIAASIISLLRSRIERSRIGLISLVALLATCPMFFTYILFYEASIVLSPTGDQVVRQIELLVAIGIALFLLPASRYTALLIVMSCALGFVAFLTIESPLRIENPIANTTISAAWIMGMVLLTHLAHRKTVQTEKSAQTARALTGSLAHEIRTPLTSIHSYAKGIEDHIDSLLIDGARSDPTILEKASLLSSAASAIQQETEYCSIFIDMALTATRPASEATSREHLSLAKTIREAIQRFPYNNSDEAEMVEIDIEDDFMVYANSQILTHSFFNLLKNAVYFAQDGGSGKVTVSLDSEMRTVCVRDNGPGIPAKNHQLIYEPFFTTRKAQTGAGLGLWFSRRALEDIGGTLIHRNAPSGGCEFEASFPTVQPRLNTSDESP